MTGEAELQRLIDIEAIKQLKARYVLCLDTKNWTLLRGLLTDDLRVEGSVEPLMLGAERFLDVISNVAQDRHTAHHVHAPIIEITGPAAARGLWAMFDDLRFGDGDPGGPAGTRRLGYGHYEEEYRRGEDGAWRISVLKLTRLFTWDEPWHGVETPAFPSSAPSWLR